MSRLGQGEGHAYCYLFSCEHHIGLRNIWPRLLKALGHHCPAEDDKEKRDYCCRHCKEPAQSVALQRAAVPTRPLRVEHPEAEGAKLCMNVEVYANRVKVDRHLFCLAYMLFS